MILTIITVPVFVTSFTKHDSFSKMIQHQGNGEHFEIRTNYLSEITNFHSFATLRCKNKLIVVKKMSPLLGKTGKTSYYIKYVRRTDGQWQWTQFLIHLDWQFHWRSGIDFDGKSAAHSSESCGDPAPWKRSGAGARRSERYLRSDFFSPVGLLKRGYQWAPHLSTKCGKHKFCRCQINSWEKNCTV